MALNGRYWCWVWLWVAACGDGPMPEIKKEEISIFFDSKSKISIRESDTTTIVVPIRISLSQEGPIVAAYETIGQEVVEGSDFTLLSENPITIPAGATTANVRLKINDNDIVQPEDRNIYLRLRAIDKDFVKLAVPSEVRINIEEDDCPADAPDVSVWIGQLTLQSTTEMVTGTGTENPSGVCSGAFNVRGKFVGAQNPESTLTIVLDQGQAMGTNGVARIVRTKLFGFTSQYELEAIGTYDEATGKIVLNYSFFDLLDSSNNFSDTLVITAG